MGNRNRRRVFWAVFLLSVLGVGFGWLWTIQGLVERENEILQNDIWKKEERLLKKIIEQRESTSNWALRVDIRSSAFVDLAEPDMERFANGEKADERQAQRLRQNSLNEINRKAAMMERFASDDVPYSGFWEKPKILLDDSDHSWSSVDSSELKKDLVMSPDEMIKQIQLLSWGDVIDGRDQLGVLILKYLRDGGNAEFVKSKLEEGVWDYRNEPMNPGFRLLLIKALEVVEPSEKLARLKLAETIRSVEGDLSQIEVKLEEEKSGAISYFYNKKQVERSFNEMEPGRITFFKPGAVFGERSLNLTPTKDEKVTYGMVTLSSEPPEDRASVKVEGLRHWPYLSFQPRQGDRESAIDIGSNVILRVGYLTGIAALGLIIVGGLVGKRELRQARARTDLAASVAHELRTPLAGQRVVLESLQKRGEYDEEYLSMALRENERLGNLAEEFLTFSRLERGVLEVQLRSLTLSEVIEPVVAGLREQWEEEVRCDLNEVTVMADEAAVATIVRNLLENAWKYSDAPRTISIRSVETDSEVGFAVEDNGIGLSKKDREKVFRQFYRVDQRLSRSREGLGIGLSIVRRLVEALDGRLEVESELGKGSTFTVYLKKGGSA